MKKLPFNVLFFLLAFFYLLIELFDLSAFRYFFKPLLLLSLAYHFFNETKSNKSYFTSMMLTGLLLSCGGDTVLLFASTDPSIFSLGLLLFLLAHVCYILAFINTIRKSLIPITSKQLLIAILPFAIISSFVFSRLKNNLGNLFYPVLAYIIIITLMGIVASLRYTRAVSRSFYLVMSGAIFFMLSDTLLAFNKFNGAFSFAGTFIMSTYIIAQYLIVKGSILHVKQI
jgi:uncharacterized membrane protein YhhN